MAIMRRPTGIDLAWPSGKSWASPASIQLTAKALALLCSHHARLQARLVGHHGLIPRRIKYQFNIRLRDRGDDLHLVAYILHQNLAHAAARRGQSHLDVDRARRVLVLADVALVDQSQIDDVDRYF